MGARRPTSRDGRRAGAAAVELRVSGASFADIATTLALSSPAEALALVERELAAHLTEGDVEVQRELAGRRLETLLATVFERATDPSDPEQLPAVRMAVAIIDRHIRLMGLDKPTQVEIYTPVAAELERVMAQVVASSVPAVIEADVVGELGA